MGKKQKFLILLFIGVFSFVVLRTWVFLKQTYLSAGAEYEIPEGISTGGLDTDGDGLSDREESFYGTDFENPDTDGDGFLDGEEVASGHDPRISAPNDIKAGAINNRAAAINITNRVSGRILASFYEKDISPDSSFNQINTVLDDIAVSTLLESYPVFVPSPVSESEILIKFTNKKEDQQIYYDAVLFILQNRLLRPFLEQLDGPEVFLINDQINQEKIDDYLTRAQTASREMRTLEVPNSWKDYHLSLLNALNEYEAVYSAMNLSAKDPIKFALGAQKLLTLNAEVQSLMIDIIENGEKQDLKTEGNSLIDLYNLLSNS